MRKASDLTNQLNVLSPVSPRGDTITPVRQPALAVRLVPVVQPIPAVQPRMLTPNIPCPSLLNQLPLEILDIVLNKLSPAEKIRIALVEKPLRNLLADHYPPTRREVLRHAHYYEKLSIYLRQGGSFIQVSIRKSEKKKDEITTDKDKLCTLYDGTLNLLFKQCYYSLAWEAKSLIEAIINMSFHIIDQKKYMATRKDIKIKHITKEASRKPLYRSNYDRFITCAQYPTFLHFAIATQQTELSRYIIEWSTNHPQGAHRIDLNARDHCNRTPLMLAFLKEEVDIVEKLLDNSEVEIHTLDNQNNSTLSLAIDSTMTLNKEAEKRLTDVVLNLLADPKAEVNSINEQGEFALLKICKRFSINKYSLKIFEALVAHGNINFNVTDTEGNTALHIACQKGHWQIVNILLTNHRRGLNVNATNSEGKTAWELGDRSNRALYNSILADKNPPPYTLRTLETLRGLMNPL